MLSFVSLLFLYFSCPDDDGRGLAFIFGGSMLLLNANITLSRRTLQNKDNAESDSFAMHKCQ